MDVLKERGIFTMMCARHEVPLLATDITTGERFDYADALITEYMKQGYGGDCINIFYDIACKYQVNFKVSIDYIYVYM